ncbi:hypothetical protein H8K32_19105 [Undibacterium jejuense]|uniref:Uncharacterized protein n=1 Tax=Undibacterium jejuense TaxID=1344949 RepID=A0A923HGR0_9BURK|nr:hypothetical protein [Undibacterium jejuense]MBC3864217.1 hypothetical protein [Undibacterium jejuense]
MSILDKLKLFPLSRAMALTLFSWSAYSSLMRGFSSHLMSEVLIGFAFIFWCLESFLKPLVFGNPTPEFLERKAQATVGSPALHHFLTVSGLVCLAGGYIARYFIER